MSLKMKQMSFIEHKVTSVHQLIQLFIVLLTNPCE